MSRINVFSEDRKYRYVLWREGLQTQHDFFTRVTGCEQEYVNFIGLNPSKADETNDDPTLRKCMKFARAWGYGAVCMTNIFAYRATLPQHMLMADDPVGPRNNHYLIEIAADAGLIVAAWGKHGEHIHRADTVQVLLGNYPVHYLRLNDDGSPEHPLYIPDSTQPVWWHPRQTASL